MADDISNPFSQPGYGFPGIPSGPAGTAFLQVLQALVQAQMTIGQNIQNTFGVSSGSWTPADSSGGGLTFSAVNANYTRIGNIVHMYAALTYPATADASAAVLSGLPVPVPNQTYAAGPAMVYANGGATSIGLSPIPNTSTARFINPNGGANKTNANLSGLTLRFILIYPAA